MTIRSNTRIKKGGVLVGSADQLNLIEGSGVTITAATAAPRDVDVTIAATAGAGGAPTDADYLVGTANGDLSGEIVVGTTPGGELGNTWASPTVDATHSGSTHAATQAAAETTAATALSTHEADTTSIHGITDTSALETTTGSQTKVDTHSADTTSVHGVADTSALETTSGSQTKVDTHTGDATAAHAATAVAFTPAGTIAATDVQAAIEEVASEAGGGGAPTDADYLVGTANGSLSGEIVVGTTPGGELGNTWASPTVDATHSGSTHSAATDTHIADAADAHDASAISLLDTAADFTATDVEGALAELQSDNEAHAAAVAAHGWTGTIYFGPPFGVAGGAQWTNQPSTEDFWSGAALMGWRGALDDSTQFRWAGNIWSAGFAGSLVVLSYNVGAGWVDIATEALTVHSFNTAWANLPAGAMADPVQIGIRGRGGNSTADPALEQISVMFR